MENSNIAFVIMQIGNPELDNLYTNYIAPAISAANLEPKRIDIDNEGSLLKKEITEYIERAEIIIADLTNERPNCYLEVGYTMGLGKYKNLIITSKEDHFHESPNFKKDGHKIHFDLTGYDILFWDADKLPKFKSNLTDKINRRLSIIRPKDKSIVKAFWDEQWLTEQRAYVYDRFSKTTNKKYMEVLISPLSSQFNYSQTDLLNTADDSQIDTFGWPIAIVYKNTPELKPRVKSDGIISEINGTVLGESYDYTYFKKNGQIFLFKSLFEDRNYPDSIIPEVRIKRTTELLMYVSRFYTRCNLPEYEGINIKVKYAGLKNNTINFAKRGVPSHIQRISNENECISEVTTTISEIETKLPELVSDLLKELFVLFDFYEANTEYMKLIVDRFVSDTNNAIR